MAATYLPVSDFDRHILRALELCCQNRFWGQPSKFGQTLQSLFLPTSGYCSSPLPKHSRRFLIVWRNPYFFGIYIGFWVMVGELRTSWTDGNKNWINSNLFNLHRLFKKMLPNHHPIVTTPRLLGSVTQLRLQRSGPGRLVSHYRFCRTKPSF